MQETGNNISTLKKIYGNNENGFRITNGSLFIFIDDEEFSFALSSRSNREFVALESWDISETGSFSDALDMALSESEILAGNSFGRIICCSGFRKSTMVPAALFDQAQTEAQLNLSVPLEPGEEIITDDNHAINARTIFAIPGDVFQAIQKQFPEAEFHHASTPLTGYLLSLKAPATEPVMTAYMHNRYFEIYVTQSRQLLFYNTFNYSSAEEVVYHMLFICEQLRLNHESIHLEFAGQISPDNQVAVLTGKYILNTGFAARPSGYMYDTAFDPLPEHFYMNLFSQYICVS